MSGHCCCSSCCQTSWAERSAQRWGPVLSSWWRSKANPPCTLSPEGKHRSQSKKYWPIDSSLDYCSASLKHCIKPSLTVCSQIWGRKKNKQGVGRVWQLVPVNFTLLNFLCMFSFIRMTCCLSQSLFSFCSSHGGNSSLSQDGSNAQEEKILHEIISLSIHPSMIHGMEMHQNTTMWTLYDWG